MKAEDLVREIERKLGTVKAEPGVANVGRVASVADGIVRVDGLSRAGFGEEVEFEVQEDTRGPKAVNVVRLNPPAEKPQRGERMDME